MDSSLRQILSPEFFEKYNVRGPRYTSYPTVPYWTPEVDGEAWARHLESKQILMTGEGKGPTISEAKAESASEDSEKPLALYVHIPFCGKRCAFCACNVIITRKEGIASRYLDTLEKELDLVAARSSGGRRVLQLHLGGGTPNYLTGDEMDRLMAMLRTRFAFHPEAEISIEVDPRTSSREEVRRLREQNGFNRISYGVQDFDEATQAAIHREQTYDITRALVEESRDAGFKSINVDLIYGLPEQSAASWRRTIDRFLDLRPSRLALYNFAFLPGKLAHQRAIAESAMPSVEEKLGMFFETNERLLNAGYRFIGMDHYALEEDDLTRALDDETLHRNFMGYTTLRGTDMLAFGVSSIGDFSAGFVQNTKKLSEYERELEAGRLPVERGLLLSEDDRRRRWTIETLMCSGVLRKEGFAARFDEDFDTYFSEEMPRLAPLVEDGLVDLSEPGVVRVTTAGRFFLRNIAMVFDAYLKPSNKGAEKKQPVFSKTL